MAPHTHPRLIVDLGGPAVRFALETAPGRLGAPAVLPPGLRTGLPAVLRACLAAVSPGAQVAPQVVHVVVVAAPASDDQPPPPRMADPDSAGLRQLLGLDTLLLIDPVRALAMALPQLDGRGLRQVGGGQTQPGRAMGLLGTGGALGVAAGLVPAAEGWLVLDGAGGQASLAPRDERELLVLRHAWRQRGSGSAEQLLGETGLVLVHQALAAEAGASAALGAAEIMQAALAGGDRLCRETVEVFCALLGTAAANLALGLDAAGGIAIGGSIVAGLGSWFDRSPFRRRFEDQGRRNLSAIPTWVITAEHATLVGAAALLDARLKAAPPPSGSAILGRIRQACGTLSPAELRVAEHVLAHPRAVLNQPVVEIARAAQVSQPTVIRFCRSLGCEGLSDFKLRLASGLTGAVPVAQVPVLEGDSPVELGSKVLGNTASALLQVRSQLNHDMLERGIALLAGAGRVELLGLGADAGVALDAQAGLLRGGLPCAAHADPALAPLVAGLLGPGALLLLVSAGGGPGPLLEAAELAHARGAAVLAITPSQSPLARKADCVLAVDPVEDAGAHAAMVCRVLQLQMVEMLTLGVTLRRQAGAAAGRVTA